MKSILKFLTRPFTEHTLLFCLLLLSFSGPWAIHNLLEYGVGEFFAAFATGFLAIYAISLIFFQNKIIRRIFIPLFLLLFIIHTILNETCFYVIKSHLTPELWGTILATHLQETTEFIQTYLSPLSLLIIILSLISFFALYFLIEYKKWGKQKFLLAKTITFLFLLIVTSIECCRHNIFKIYFIPEFKYYNGEFSLKDMAGHFQEQTILLDLYNQKINIQKTADSSPNKVVVILGESFSKKHSQLYNYDKQTSPKLHTLQNDSLLAVYSNVQSSHVTTNESFKTILNTYNPDMPYKWYESLSLVSIFKTMGYNTTWITTQPQAAVYNSVQDKYANQSDVTIRTPNPKTQDNWILNQTKQIKNNNREVLFLHMYGQHHPYRCRYPSYFRFFKKSDYTNHPENQRQILADYDNATLYNDSIVYELMTAYQNDDVIVFYFPDHGEDVFDVDSTFAGHGRTTIKESFDITRQIPFMIYVSPTYKQKHPEETKRIFSSVANNFVTDNFTYSAMDILGYKFKDNDFVEKYTLFHD